MNTGKTITYRRIFKQALTGQGIVQELMQFIFFSELLRPSPSVWIVSPWISNVEILNNQSGNFDVINPEWRRRNIRVIDLCLQIATNGTKLYVVTKKGEEHNEKFLKQLRGEGRSTGLISRIKIIEHKNLHRKGIVTGSGSLSGSMNITYNGFKIEDQEITYYTDKQDIASATDAFETDYLDGDIHE